MKATTQADMDTDAGWTKVSSSKPFVIGLLATGILAGFLISLLADQDALLPLVAAGAALVTGVIALNWKVIHRRGADYRITTFFYSEVVTVDDVCMTVRNPGPFWTRVRIHLRRPARFGWRFSFVPADQSFNHNAAAKEPR